jgi:tRNA threonylcarbamoyladenosine biosynthesis protein TsaB
VILLGMDTATSAISVAVCRDSFALSRAVVDARGHAEHLAPLVREVLREATLQPTDLTDVAVGTGPGPFTGLRVGLVTARTMGLALGIPVHGVCSLDALAWMAARERDGEFLVATDARRKEVYWSRYTAESGAIRRMSDPAVDRPAEMASDVRMLPTAGRAPLLFPELFPRSIGILDVDAVAIGRLAQDGIASGEPMPVEARYLRRPDALPLAARHRALSRPSAQQGGDR